jgi:hypothetical protein
MQTQLSFRGAGAAREPGIQKHRKLIWIPDSLAEPVIEPAFGRTRWLGFRNDGGRKTP